MTVQDLDIDVLDDLSPIEHELEDVCVGLESMGSNLAAIYGDVLGERGINRSVAEQINQIDPTLLPRRYPVNSFTLQSSQTNLKPALEAIEGKTAAVIAAIAAAIAAFIYKIYKWITKSNDSISASATSLAEKSDKLDAAVEKRSEIVQELKKNLTPAEAEELKKKVDMDEKIQRIKEAWGKDYNELIHYAWNPHGPIDVAKALVASYSLLQRMSMFVEGAANMYIDLVNNPSKGRDETPTDKEKMMDEWLGATSTKSVIHTQIYPMMKNIIRELEASKVKANTTFKDDILCVQDLTDRIHKQLHEMAHTPMDIPVGFYNFWDTGTHPAMDIFKTNYIGVAGYYAKQNLDKFEAKIKRITERVEAAANKTFPDSTNPDLVAQLGDMRKVIMVLFKIIANLLNINKTINGPLDRYYDNNFRYCTTTSERLSADHPDLLAIT
jgi:peptidyl-tRNA hydrolase